MENMRTDQGVRGERRDTGKTLRDKQAAEQAADQVVDLARRTADALLVTARVKADHETEHSAAIEQANLENDRVRADEVLQGERATADERLRQEREDGSHVLAELLPLEREQTDRDLLTERARSEQAIANRDGFLAIASHDLRNLLAGIVLASGSLCKEGPEADRERLVLAAGKRIQLYAARMNRLIRDLVDVVSIDAGSVASTIVPSDPRVLIAETLEMFRPTAAGKGVALESQVEGTLPLASFDHERMLQVFANLVSNALKFTSRGGSVGIRGERTGDDVLFSVSDTGVGIPQSMFDAVFLRFWQAAPNDPRGTGLGLYISKSLVEAHRGRIWIESKVGQGSVFHFTIPVAAGA